MFWCLGETPTPFSLTPETTSLPLLPSHSVVSTKGSSLPSGRPRSQFNVRNARIVQPDCRSLVSSHPWSFSKRLRSVRFWTHIRGSFASGEALPSLGWDGQRHMFTYYPIRSTGHHQLLQKVSQRRVPKLGNGSDSGYSPLRVIIRRCPVSVTSIRDLQSRGRVGNTHRYSNRVFPYNRHHGVLLSSFLIS